MQGLRPAREDERSVGPERRYEHRARPRNDRSTIIAKDQINRLPYVLDERQHIPRAAHCVAFPIVQAHARASAEKPPTIKGGVP